MALSGQVGPSASDRVRNKEFLGSGTSFPVCGKHLFKGIDGNGRHRRQRAFDNSRDGWIADPSIEEGGNCDLVGSVEHCWCSAAKASRFGGQR